ncbi:MAG: hypothetical protein ACE366_13540 [Bradymonadia bacterium]
MPEINPVVELWARDFSPDVVRCLAVACGTPTRGPKRRLPITTVAKRCVEALLAEGPDELVPHMEPGDRELLRQVLGHTAETLGPADPFRASWAALQRMAPPEPVKPAARTPDGTADDLVVVLQGGLTCHAHPLPHSARLLVHGREVAAQVEAPKVFDALRGKKLWLPSQWRETPERTLDRFTECLEGPDFTQRRLRARAWPRLLSLLPMVQPVSKVSFALGEEGERLKGWTPRQLLRLVFSSWLRHDDYDGLESLIRVSERDEIVDLTGITTAPLRRLKAVGALKLLPVGQWVDMARFLEHAYALDMLPQVAPNMVIWGYDPGRWMAFRLPPDDPRGPLYRLTAPFMLTVLFEVMATLGIIDVAWLRGGLGIFRRHDMVSYPDIKRAQPYDRLTHVRLTELGAWLLDPYNGVPEASGEAGGGAGDLDALADLLL